MDWINNKSGIKLMKEFYRAFHKTSNSAGIKILSDDNCCRLLAWLLHFGGGREETILNFRLNEDILEAQNRLNLYGGECANARLLPVLNAYDSDAEDYLGGKTVKPQWIAEIEKKYGLIPYKDTKTI
jgi:hypothetical protein